MLVRFATAGNVSFEERHAVAFLLSISSVHLFSFAYSQALSVFSCRTSFAVSLFSWHLVATNTVGDRHGLLHCNSYIALYSTDVWCHFTSTPGLLDEAVFVECVRMWCVPMFTYIWAHVCVPVESEIGIGWPPMWISTLNIKIEPLFWTQRSLIQLV